MRSFTGQYVTWLSLVGDAHTTVYPRDYFMSVLPWNIKKFDEGWFILILDKAHEQYLGTRVVAINDIPIDEVVERTRQVVSYEADTWLWQKAPDVLGWKEALEYLDIVEPDEPVLVTVETAQGAEETFELPAYDDWSDEKKQEVLVGFQRDSVPVTAEQGCNLLVDSAGRKHLLHPVQQLQGGPRPADGAVCPAGGGGFRKRRLPKYHH